MNKNLKKRSKSATVPVNPRVHELKKLLQGMTPKNRHAALDFGAAMGKEVWSPRE